MNQDFKCFIRLHKYEVLNTEEIKNERNDIIGKIIISRCINCGKLKAFKIYTTNGIYR